MAFTWDKNTELAAALIAAGNLSLEVIAERCDTNRKTLAKWRKDPQFQARVEDELVEFRAEVRRMGLGTVEKRVHALNDRWNRLRKVIEARAEDPRFADVPGGSTGMIALISVKQIGMGESAQLVSIFGVDTGILRELREIEKQAAQELGQWNEKDGVPERPDLVAAHEAIEQGAREYDERQRQLASGEITEQEADALDFDGYQGEDD